MPENAQPATPGGGAAPSIAEPPYAYIRNALTAGRVIPFLGAGASLVGREANDTWKSPVDGFPPKTNELASYLDLNSGYPSSEPEDLTRVAQYFDAVTGRAGLEDTLRTIFSKAYTPSSVHRYFTTFTNILIVTTNYDTLLEQAFGETPHHVVVYNAAEPNLLLWEHGASAPTILTGQESAFPGLGKVPIIFKMHGAPDPRDPERDSYVITEDDYLEFLSRMQSQRAIPLMFAERFRRSHFLFLGYGLKDWNLRVILHRIWRDRALPAPETDEAGGVAVRPKRRASWAIQATVQALEQQFWSKRDLSIYRMTVDDFIARLQHSE
jgi:hypothetical protein